MKFVTGGVFGNPEAAARKLLEPAHSFEPVQDRRFYVEKINAPMLYGTRRHLKGDLKLAIERGWSGEASICFS
jgi:hypothetical protein